MILPKKIAASILSADFARLGEEANSILKAGADLIHFDVMDNHYVPNLTVGPMVCSALRKHGIQADIDVHLMTEPVDRLIKNFAEAQATSISFHPEASHQVDRSLQLIHEHNIKAGLVLNPETPLDVLDFELDNLDYVLIMSVNPGFAGQKFIPTALEKIRLLRTMLDNNGKHNIDIEVDGGIKLDNIAEIANAGANIFVMGSALFGSDDYVKTVKQIKSELGK